MAMLRVFLFSVFFGLVGVPAFVQSQTDAKDDGDSCIMYGKDHMFAIKLPQGWVVNPEIGKRLGLHAVMYPEGSSWRDSVVTMYSSFVHKGKDNNTLEAIIEEDVSGYRKESANLKIEDVAPFPIGGGKERVVVKHFSGDNGGNFDAVAYIEENKVVVMLVLNSRTEKDFQSALAAFRQLVGSYRFISENVTFQK
jgi:hypothetical protein